MLDRHKLEELKKAMAASATAEGSKKVNVRGKEWRGLRVEPGVQVKMKGEEESSGKKRALLDAPEERGNAIKSRRLSMAACHGLRSESGMASGICVQENAGGAVRAQFNKILKETLRARISSVIFKFFLAKTRKLAWH